MYIYIYIYFSLSIYIYIYIYMHMYTKSDGWTSRLDFVAAASFENKQLKQ